MSFSVSINFNGNCRQAVTFYAQVFGQEPPQFLTYGEGDASFDPNFQVSEQMKDWVMLAYLDIAGTVVEFSDMPDNFDFIRGNSFSLTVHCSTPEEGQEIFHRLTDGGQAFVPYGPVPGMGHYGMGADPFGLTWIISAA